MPRVSEESHLLQRLALGPLLLSHVPSSAAAVAANRNSSPFPAPASSTTPEGTSLFPPVSQQQCVLIWRHGLALLGSGSLLPFPSRLGPFCAPAPLAPRLAGVFLGLQKSRPSSSPVPITRVLERVKGQLTPHASFPRQLRLLCSLQAFNGAPLANSHLTLFGAPSSPWPRVPRPLGSPSACPELRPGFPSA